MKKVALLAAMVLAAPSVGLAKKDPCAILKVESDPFSGQSVVSTTFAYMRSEGSDWRTALGPWTVSAGPSGIGLVVKAYYRVIKDTTIPADSEFQFMMSDSSILSLKTSSSVNSDTIVGSDAAYGVVGLPLTLTPDDLKKLSTVYPTHIRGDFGFGVETIEIIQTDVEKKLPVAAACLAQILAAPTSAP